MPANYTATTVHIPKNWQNPWPITHSFSNGATLILEWTIDEVMVNLINMPCIGIVPRSHETSMISMPKIAQKRYH